VAFSPDGRRIATGVRVWDVEKAAITEEYERALDTETVAAAGADMPWLVIDGRVETEVTSAVNKTEIAWLPAVFSAWAVHPSGRTWAGRCFGGTQFHVITLEGTK
jgi:hypothetical protein